MKKYYLLLTSLFLMAGTVCAQSFTDTTSNGIPLEYTVNSGTTTVTLTGHGSPCADTLNIPSMVIYNGLSYYVTIIGDSAFYDCIDLISVSIPNTVTHIDSLAFRGCTGLTTLIIPNSVTTIGNRAFLNCMNLESITIGNSVTSIGEWAFYYCSELNSLTIPNSVTSIGDHAFSMCYNIQTLTLSNNITSIGDNTFSRCESLVSVTIPNSVISIGRAAFSYCLSLSSAIIGNSVSYIGESAFAGCSNLTSMISLRSTPATLGNNAFNNIPTNIPCHVPCGADTAYRADTSWNHFTNIIGTCPRIITQSTDSTMGTVTGGGSYGIGDTTILTAIPVCGYRFVQWNDGDTSNPRQIIVYDNDTFTAQFDSIRYIVATPSGQDLYYTINCSTRTARLVLPDGNIAYGTHLSGNLTVPSYVYINGDYYTVTAIGAGAFAYCYNLTSVTLPNTITTIGARAFLFDDSLTSVTLPSSLTTICYAAFQGCMGLQSITLPNHLTTIELGVFAECNSLTSVHIPASVTHIENQIFARCQNLTTITVDTNNPVYDSRDNCNAIIETATNTLINACNNTTIIPASVTAIGNYAFSGCSNLSTLTVLATVPPSLGNNVFQQVPNNIRVIVPCGSEAAYRADSGWSYFTNIVCPTTPSILVTGLANDSLMGSVTGNGLYAEGDTATLTATANCGYRFDHWNDSVTDNPRQVVVTADTTFTAFFVSDADTVFIHDTTTVRDTLMLHDTLLVHDTLTVYDTLTLHDTVGVALAYYTLTVSADQLSGIAVGSGRFSDSTIVEIVAIPVEGNQFMQWSDGSLENPRHVVMTEDITLQAIFDMPPIPTGVSETDFPNAEVTVSGATISVRGAEGAHVRVYDVQGRLMGSTPQAAADQRFRMPATGVYLVQLGNGAARRVVVR